jgi:hypothetical protein
MLTAEALAAYTGSGVHCLGPLDPTLGGGAVRAVLEAVPADELAAHPLSYRPRRAADDPTFEPYRGVERALWVRHPIADRPPLPVRALVVWSAGKARLDAQRRLTDLRRLEADLADLATKVGRRPYTTAAAVEKRAAALLRHQRARPFVHVTVGAGAAGPTLTWIWDDDALAAAAALDGRYVLGTTAPTLDAEQMLARSKERDVPEKRFATVKGPLAIRPVYLHSQERILGLVFCTMVALLAFALLELLARRAGVAHSGRALLQQFAPLTVLVLVLKDGSRLRRVTGLSPPLADILAALGWPPAARYLAVHD